MAANLTVPDLKFEKYTLSNGLDTIRSQGFDRAEADSTTSGATDTAILYGSSGNDRAYAYSDRAYLMQEATLPAWQNHAKGFKSVLVDVASTAGGNAASRMSAVCGGSRVSNWLSVSDGLMKWSLRCFSRRSIRARLTAR